MICGLKVYFLIEIINLLIGALLLALAKSIYYMYDDTVTVVQTIPCNLSHY